MQHFNPDPKPLASPFRGMLIDLLDTSLNDEELFTALNKKLGDYVEAQRVANLTTYTKYLH